MYILAFGSFFDERTRAYSTASTLAEAHTRLRAAGYRKVRKRYYEDDARGFWCKVVKPSTEIL